MSERRHPEDPQDLLLVDDKLKSTAQAPDPLQRSHQNTEAHRVEEPHAAEIHREVDAVRIHQVRQPLSEYRRGMDVELTRDLHDREAIAFATCDLDSHCSALLMVGSNRRVLGARL